MDLPQSQIVKMNLGRKIKWSWRQTGNIYILYLRGENEPENDPEKEGPEKHEDLGRVMLEKSKREHL